MGAGFIRRFTFDPGLAKILEIEGVVIIDRDAPSATTGLGVGAALCVGEFEDGPFEEPTELFSGTDFVNTFGSFGFVHDGLPSSNPCARARNADSAISPEYWNGNGFIALASKKFARLFCTRVDTSVGAVEFSRLPALLGNDKFNWELANSDTLALLKSVSDIDVATFSGAAATTNSAAGTYPTTFVGGESMNVTIDEGTPLQIGPVDIVFQAADQTQAQVISRINSVLGYTAAADETGAVTSLTGRIEGNTGNVKVNSVSSALVTTATGFSAVTAVGTGNVANLLAVTFAEIKAIVEAAVNNVLVDRDADGKLRISCTSGSELQILSGSLADEKLGFVPNQTARQPDGYAFMYSAAGTYPTTFAGGETLTMGFDDEADVTVVFVDADETQAQVISRINTVFGRTVVASASATVLKFTGSKNGGQVRIVAASASVLTKLGLTLGTTLAVENVASIVPAGTRVANSGGTRWVTMQSFAVAVDDAGPYSVKVRPAVDDGSAGSAAPATVTTLVDAVVGGAWSVTNPLTVAAALSEAAIDAAYATAIDATKSQSNVSRDTNVIFAARQSNAVRVALKGNAPDASASLRGRVACIRPPLGTTRAVAKSGVSQPGVGTYRNERVNYCFPAVSIFVPQIAARGLAGGDGFTADGYLDVGFDSWVASLISQVPPEQDIGQVTDFTSAIVGLERGNADVQSLEMADYISFKAAGIVAPRMDDGTCIAQSDVTSVDSSTFPGKADGFRRRMADYIQDTLARTNNRFAKKPMTRARRSEIFAENDGFLLGLKNPTDPDSSRIEGYVINAKDGNTATTLGAGVFRLKIRVRLNANIKDIVLDMEIGQQVVITEAA